MTRVMQTIRVRMSSDGSSKSEPSASSLLKDLGPVITGVGTLIFSIVSWRYLHTLDVEHAALEKGKVEAAEAELRQKAAARYFGKDDEKKSGPMILAGYDEKAFPALHMFLAGDPSDPDYSGMREYGVKVAGYLFSAGTKETRLSLLHSLTEWGRSPSNGIRRGAYACLLNVSSDLKPAEADVVVAFLNSRFAVQDGALLEDDQEVGKTVCDLLHPFAWRQLRSVAMNLVLHSSSSNFVVVNQVLGPIDTFAGATPIGADLDLFINDLRGLIGSAAGQIVKTRLQGSLKKATQRQTAGVKQ
jgi:hypothetical protein